jgi:hypothetical protein
MKNLIIDNLLIIEGILILTYLSNKSMSSDTATVGVCYRSMYASINCTGVFCHLALEELFLIFLFVGTALFYECQVL